MSAANTALFAATRLIGRFDNEECTISISMVKTVWLGKREETFNPVTEDNA